jgi:hypothetical protein
VSDRRIKAVRPEMQVLVGRKEAALRHSIPEMWLIGCCRGLEREGLNPLEAIRRAIEIWDEQTRLAAQWEAERA